jgi:autotransporter-associated beta strand protein
MFVWLHLASVTSFAGSATWNLSPSSGEWKTATNWTPATVPNGPADTATFGVSNATNPSILDFDDEVNGIVFNAGASQFVIEVSFDHLLTISGLGITNNSGITQTVILNFGGVLQFTNSASAGDLTTLFAWDGSINFYNDSNGGTARVLLGLPYPSGSLNISAHNAPGVTLGSIEGDGLVALGANNLTVGSNNLSTICSATIKGTGSLTKIGAGSLTLEGSSKYSGGTVVNEGVLLINNKRTSGTGKRPVQVNAGTLGGTGTIGGAVTVGTGSGSGAVLSPGVDALSHRTLTLRSTLTFNSDATYKCGFNSNTARADKVVADRVTINGGAQFSFDDSNASALPFGTVFTVVDNTAGNPIAGTFLNLADDSTFTVGSNTFQANYEGGDGNDLALTVVP